MKTWVSFEGSSSDWDRVLCELSRVNIFHSAAWALVQESDGWMTRRLISSEAHAAQVFFRRIGRSVTVGWIPGGVAGDNPEISRSFYYALRTFVPGKLSLFRIAFPHSEPTPNAAFDPWRPASRPLGATRSFVLDLQKDISTIHDGLGGNWRRNLKRSAKTPLTTRILGTQDAESVDHLEQEMRTYKGLAIPTTKSAGTLMRLLGTRLKSIGVFDSSDRLIAVRGAALFGNDAHDMIAATSVKGRKVYGSYLATWSLISHLKECETLRYNLSGFDRSSNSGVANFKAGIGGTEVLYPQELEVGSPQILRRLGVLLSS